MRLGILTVGLLAGISAGHARGEDSAPATTPPPKWDLVAFETKSWAAPLSSWRLGKDGSGSWIEAVSEEKAPLNTYVLVNHEIDRDIDNYLKIERLFATLPVPAPDPDDCTNFMTDMPYGTVRLTRGATTTEIAWNAGCLDDEYGSFLEILRQADTFVREKGATGKVLWSKPSR